MQDQAFSFSSAAWKRLRKNGPALAGLVLVIIAILVALTAYWIAPDPSPMANRMMVEIAGRKPGFRMRFVGIDKVPPPPEVTLLERTLGGRIDRQVYIPVISWTEKADSLVVAQYLDEGLADRRAYAIAPGGYRILERTFWLGTDKYGRDILSRLLIGTRVSLGVGGVAVLISLVIGVSLGAAAGYFGGRVDGVILWIINVVWSIPTLLLVFAITLVLGKGFWQVFIAVGLTLWVNVARLIRGQVMGLKELEYVEAARALGFSDLRTIVRHILPNVLGPVLVIAASNFATAIVLEAGLSFLGVGVQSPQPSWGLMIKENYNFIITHNPMLAIIPGLAIMSLVLAFNLLGNGLRDALDVKGRI
jgi:ABC-type dipeptide/oligopeptide/nickel transport system permease subunit